MESRRPVSPRPLPEITGMLKKGEEVCNEFSLPMALFRNDEKIKIDWSRFDFRC